MSSSLILHLRGMLYQLTSPQVSPGFAPPEPTIISRLIWVAGWLLRFVAAHDENHGQRLVDGLSASSNINIKWPPRECRPMIHRLPYVPERVAEDSISTVTENTAVQG
jgi:hypothetical protein